VEGGPGEASSQKEGGEHIGRRKGLSQKEGDSDGNLFPLLARLEEGGRVTPSSRAEKEKKNLLSSLTRKGVSKPSRGREELDHLYFFRRKKG